MKKVILAMILTLMVSLTYSQVRFDARLGANLSGMSEGGMTMKFGLKAGFGVDYAFTELFAVRSGVFYSMKGVTDAKNPFDFYPNNSIKLNYVEIPVLVSFSFKIVEGFGIKLNAGPSIGYCISNKPSVYSQMYSYEIGANMGIDFVFNKKYIIGVESQYGLSKITDQNNSLHNINYSLIFGYSF